MKYNDIIKLTAQEFISELKRKNSRVSHNPAVWLNAWIVANKTTKLTKEQKRKLSRSFEFADVDEYHSVDNCRKAVINTCVEYLQSL